MTPELLILILTLTSNFNYFVIIFVIEIIDVTTLLKVWKVNKDLAINQQQIIKVMFKEIYEIMRFMTI